MATETNIRVICRCRPLNDLEKSMGGETCVTLIENTISVRIKEGGESEQEKKFVFDEVIDPECSQEEVFNLAGVPLLKHAMRGYNATIFAYGQTSSGKTFTMEGKDLHDEKYKGIIPRVMDELFDMIDESDENIEFQIRVSMLEIYNEKIKDLVAPENNNLKVKECKKRGIYVDGCSEVFVSGPDEMKKVMILGTKNRAVASTRMNATSSRSHSIFMLTISQRDLSTDTSKESRIYFVDLAGSEKVAKTNVKGKELNEAKNINKSLTTLGIVINQLAEAKKGAHIPYRDSKLTRLLQDSLGGNSMTTLLIACSMCSYNDKETLTTMRFGARAKNIKNKPKENVERSAKELLGLLDQAESRIISYEQLILEMKQVIDQNGINIENLPTAQIISILEKREQPATTDLKIDISTPETIEIIKEENTEDVSEVELLDEQLLESNGKVQKNEGKSEGNPEETKDIDQRFKIRLMEQEQEIQELNQNMHFLQNELDSLVEQNINLETKVEALSDLSRTILKCYSNELFRIHSIHENHLVMLSNRSIKFENTLSQIEKLSGLFGDLSNNRGRLGEMNRLADPINEYLLIESQLKLGSFDPNDSIGCLFEKLKENIEELHFNLSHSRPETRDYLSIDINLLNKKRFIQELDSILSKESFMDFGDTSTNAGDSIDLLAQPNLQEDNEESSGDDDLLRIMTGDAGTDQKFSELQRLIVSQRLANETLVLEKDRILKEMHVLNQKYRIHINSSSTEKSEIIGKFEKEKQDELSQIIQELSLSRESNRDLEMERDRLITEVDRLKQLIEESLIYNNLPTEGNEAQISDVDTLSHRAMRYRKERNNYREKMNEIKVSLIQKDEAYRDAIKKSELFSSILKEQEFEIQSLKEFIEQNNHTVDVNELIHSKKVRTLRGGGGKKSKTKSPMKNLFSLMQDSQIDDLMPGKDEVKMLFEKKEDDIYHLDELKVIRKKEFAEKSQRLLSKNESSNNLFKKKLSNVKSEMTGGVKSIFKSVKGIFKNNS